MKEGIISQKNEIRGIFGRIKRRDLKGNSGQAIKNSVFQFTRTFISKVGSIIFTIFLARLLLPELFGLYSLTFATLSFFSVIADLGLENSIITFLSKSLGKKDYSKAKGYFMHILKIKLYLTLASTFLILISAYFIANMYYNKPIFYALIIGAFYVAIVSFINFLSAVIVSENKFNIITKKEFIFQISRLVVVPLVIILLTKSVLANQAILFWIFVTLGILNFAMVAYLLSNLKKYSSFINASEKKLTSNEKKRFNKFLLPITATALSGILFGYIDMIMLGRYVAEEFIGYYSLSFNLAISASLIFGFSSVALFPIFSRLKGKRLKAGFKKSRRITFLISLIGGILIFLAAEPLVKIIYGSKYILAIPLLRIFSIILITEPLVTLYLYYYMAQERTRALAFLLIFTTLLNIILNYLFITAGLKISMNAAVTGACYATVASKLIYLLGLGTLRKR